MKRPSPPASSATKLFAKKARALLSSAVSEARHDRLPVRRAAGISAHPVPGATWQEQDAGSAKGREGALADRPGCQPGSSPNETGSVSAFRRDRRCAAAETSLPTPASASMSRTRRPGRRERIPASGFTADRRTLRPAASWDRGRACRAKGPHIGDVADGLGIAFDDRRIRIAGRGNELRPKAPA